MTTIYSDLATNDVASPRVMNSPSKGGQGTVKEITALLAPAADQADDSVMWVARVPTNCRIIKLAVTAADATTAGKIDLGVYRTPEQGGAVIDRDFFAAALDLASGPYAESDQKNQSTTYTYAKQAQPLWQAVAVDSSDPGGEYYLCATVETLFNGGPTAIQIKIQYVS